MAFTLAQFQLVLAIRKHGSLGKVALAEGVTQPGLSRSLKELERRLGVTLFERHPSGLRATPFCLAILPYAANAVEEAARALEEIRVLAGESPEVLRIGAISSAAASLLPPLVERLTSVMPEISIRIIEGVDEVLVDALLARDVDTIICGTPQESDGIAKALDLGVGDTCALLARTGHPLCERPDASVEELLDHPLTMLPRDSVLRTYFEQLVRAQGLPPPRVLVETRSISVIRRLVVEQGYITWGPIPLYISGGTEIAILDWPQFQMRRTFFAYRLRQATMSGAVRRALNILRQLTANPHSR